MDLKDKIVVITGGSRGIGKAVAESVSREGAIVYICSRSKNDLMKVCESIKKNGGKCEYTVVDATKGSQVNEFIDKIVSLHGKIDVLINNAGWSNMKSYIEDVSDEDYKTCLSSNVDSVFFFIRKVLPLMKKQNNGMIINMSSGAGKSSNPILPIYSASKFAVQAFTEAVAKETKELNLNVKCISICPSGVNTGMRTALFGKRDAEAQQSPESVANVIKDIVMEKIAVPNGGDVYIRNGKLSGVSDILANVIKR